MRLYGIFKGDEKIDEGSAVQLAKKYGTTRYAIYDANIDQSKFLWKYDVRVVGQIKGERISHLKEEVRDHTQMYLDHLDRYGNVAVAKSDSRNVKKLVERLDRMGYECRVIKHKWPITIEIGMENQNEKRGRQRKETTYVLERI